MDGLPIKFSLKERKKKSPTIFIDSHSMWLHTLSLCFNSSLTNGLD